MQSVSFDVQPGRLLLVLGPSGSGKSTLALAVAGLVPRDRAGEWSGELEVDGIAAASGDRAALARAVGLLVQDPDAQLVHERVEDDVAFGLENLGWSRPDMLRRVPEALADAGALDLANAATTRLSGGQQQRVALAGVLAPRPPVLVLDEPTSNLDPAATARFAERLAAIRAERRTTVVLVEHRVDLVWHLADLVLALGADGTPLAFGAPDSVLRDAGSRLAAEGVWLPGDSVIDSPVRRARPSPGADATPVVVARDLGFRYEDGTVALRDVDVSIAPGERVALVGPNGSGKSTLGRLLVGLLPPTTGAVRLLGAPPHRLSPAELARRAGYVFQDPERQFLTARVADEVHLGLAQAELGAVPALMDRLGLPLIEFGERSPYALSGGEQRRLSLACGLVRSPRLLVVDEPTWGQDRRGHDALVAILDEHVADGTAVVIATHDRRLVRAAADRVIELDGGVVATTDAAA